MSSPDGPDRESIEGLHKANGANHIALTRHLCELILADHPNHVTTLVVYARNLTELSLYDEAETALDRAEPLANRKLRSKILDQRGHLESKRGNLGVAVKLHLHAHRMHPANATHLIYAASAAFSQGELERAVELSRKAIECPEGCIDEALYNLGGYLLAQQNYFEAIDCYHRALEIDPDYRVAKHNLEDAEKVVAHLSNQT